MGSLVDELCAPLPTKGVCFLTFVIALPSAQLW